MAWKVEINWTTALTRSWLVQQRKQQPQTAMTKWCLIYMRRSNHNNENCDICECSFIVLIRHTMKYCIFFPSFFWFGSFAFNRHVAALFYQWNHYIFYCTNEYSSSRLSLKKKLHKIIILVSILDFEHRWSSIPYSAVI